MKPLWSVEKVHEKVTGFKAISIKRGHLSVASMIMQLDDREMELARFIVKACNVEEGEYIDEVCLRGALAALVAECQQLGHSSDALDRAEAAIASDQS